ncbi:TNF receptor-associated factor 4-like [Dysidea avara]|uniref:TNF receptor-associated factor 4-like n=1 Tax=Dysidea avara TaxID=196820 RepID=UPI00331A54A2
MRLQRKLFDLHGEFECPNCEAYCQLCYVVGKKHFIESGHMDECPKLPLPCPNHCQDALILREGMASHRAACPLERVKCEYFQMGCDVAILRRDMADHNVRTMSKHLDLSKQCINKIASKYAILKSSLKEANAQLVEKEKTLQDTLSVVEYNQWPLKISSEASHCSYGVHVLPLVIRVTQIARKKRRDQDWYSNGFLTDVGGYKLRLVVNVSGPHGTHMAVYTQLMSGPNDDILSWPLKGKFVVKLLNQVRDSEHHTKTWVYNNATPRHVTGQVMHGNKAKLWGARSFISSARLHSYTPTCSYINNDCIYFKVFFEQL